MVGITLAVLLLVFASVAAAADTLTITARQAAVRAGPDSKQTILTTVQQGTTFALLETRKGWYKMLFDDGREGWIAQAAAQVHPERGLIVPPAAASSSQVRTALVIGNAAYNEDIGPLKNPGNDATDMAATLRQLGFAVTLVRDASHQRMDEAVEDFSRQLRPGSVAVFYYAGHGAQVGGRNYLIPLGARITTVAVVPYQAVAAEEVLARMEAAGQGKSLNVIILDACRNAPFMRGWRSPLRGLAPMQATGGSLIAYATAPGSVAKDGTGRNGTYTQHLLRFMTEPNLPVTEMFIKVRLAVQQETNGAQIPWEQSSLLGSFSFQLVAAGLPSGTQVTVETSLSHTLPVTTNPMPPVGTSRPSTETTPGSVLPSPSGGTQVAVGVYPEAPKTLRNSIGMEFVLIPAGEFQMGSNDAQASGNEKPVHTVRLTRVFYLGKYEVTQAQWEAVMENNPSHFKGDAALPVESVSWEDAQEFISRLNTREHGTAFYRLPTEAEWEYAARAGSTTVYSFGNSASDLGRYAWHGENAGYKTHPVGQLQPNAWGLYDMHGNVWEWVQDGSGAYSSGTAVDPAGPASSSYRVHRGGGWINDARYCRSTSRESHASGDRLLHLGLRLLRVAQ
jgi:formylglycine-generating enzyme required for sulfatase activity